MSQHSRVLSLGLGLLALCGPLPLTATAGAQLVFEPPVMSTGGPMGSGVLLGNLDADGVPDAVTSHQIFGTGPTVSLGLGDGSFGTPQPIAGLNSQHVALRLRDVNADGLLDLLARGSPFSAAPVFVMLGDGRGGFDSSVNVNVPDGAPSDADFGDFDNDGLLDVAIANMQTHFSPLSLVVNFGRGEGTFDGPVKLPGYDVSILLGETTLRCGDINGDGLDDIVYSGFNGHAAQLSDGDGSFTPVVCPGVCTELPEGEFELEDLNADGRQDALTLTGSLLATPQGTFVQAQTFSMQLFGQTHAPRGLTVADLDGDGETDVLLARQILQQPDVGSALMLRGLGDGTFAEPGLVVSFVPLPRDVAAADLDADGRTDAVIAVQSTDALSLATLLNHTYGPGSPFLDLGGALPGNNGHPILLAEGSLLTGSSFSFALHHGTQNGFASIYVGFSQLNAPFKGGVFVPFPNVRIGPVPLNANGALTLSGTWPAGASGLTFWMQYWMTNPGGPAGFASSSGLRVQVP